MKGLAYLLPVVLVGACAVPDRRPLVHEWVYQFCYVLPEAAKERGEALLTSIATVRVGDRDDPCERFNASLSAYEFTPLNTDKLSGNSYEWAVARHKELEEQYKRDGVRVTLVDVW